MKELDAGFEVKWCTDQPLDKSGENNPELWEYSSRDFADHKDALAFAKEILPKDQIGEVTIKEFEIKRYEHREYIGETEFVNIND